MFALFGTISWKVAYQVQVGMAGESRCSCATKQSSACDLIRVDLINH